MKDKWQWMLDKFDALSKRERLIVLLGMLALFYQLGDMLLLSGQYQQVQQLHSQIERQRKDITQTQLQLAETNLAMASNPNRVVREQNNRLQQQIQEQREQLKALTGQLLSPHQMPSLLERMLAEQGGLSLLALRTLEPTLLNPVKGKRGAGVPSDEQQSVYVHRFALEFEGDYFSILRYLESLEQQGLGFAWERVEFRVMQHPRSRVLLQLQTLSLSEDWIGV